jgi:hypothetical protein
VSRSGEGVGGTGRFPRNEFLDVRGHLRAARFEAYFREGGSWGKQGFPHATELQAREAAA